jgi:hypothetical protein
LGAADGGAAAGAPHAGPTEKELTMQANPIRRIGYWAELSPEQRRRAVTRGLDKIFEAAVRIRLGNLR